MIAIAKREERSADRVVMPLWIYLEEKYSGSGCCLIANAVQLIVVQLML